MSVPTLIESESAVGLIALAEHHWQQGLWHAKAAHSNAPWYHDHAKDTAKAANHFAVAAALRAQTPGGK